MDMVKENGILSYELFKEKILAVLCEHYGSDGKVMIHKVIKVNIGELTGICIKKANMMQTPTLYIEQLYGEYMRCGSFSQVFEKIIAVFSMESKAHFNLQVPDLRDPGVVLEKAYCQVIGAKENEALLETVPHKRHDDLAFIYRIMIRKDEGEVCSARIDNINFNSFGTSLEKLHKEALANTQEFFPPKLIELAGSAHFPAFMQKERPLLVLTHEMKTHGAVAAFYPDVLQGISDRLESDLFLLPSSIHEFIILPDTGDSDIRELRKIVKDVNFSVVDKEDQLSNSVYSFKNGEKNLALCKTERGKNRRRDER